MVTGNATMAKNKQTGKPELTVPCNIFAPCVSLAVRHNSDNVLLGETLALTF